MAIVAILVFVSVAAVTFEISVSLRNPPAATSLNTTSTLPVTESSSTLVKTTSNSSSSTAAASNSTTVSTNSTSTCPVSPCDVPQLAIFNVVGDVDGPADNRLATNDTSIFGDTLWLGGTPGSDVPVLFQIGYSACVSCPVFVTNVTALTPGFTVVQVSPSLPIMGNYTAGFGTGSVQWTFTVYVQSPPTAYNGQLVLLAYTRFE